jgi:hypothetical protein
MDDTGFMDPFDRSASRRVPLSTNPTLATAAAAWTAAHDRDTYREDLGALIDALLADACRS